MTESLLWVEGYRPKTIDDCILSDTGNVSSDNFSTKVGSTDKTFHMIFKTENFSTIAEGAYNISLSSKRISHFKREGDSLQYWIALEQNSAFDGG